MKLPSIIFFLLLQVILSQAQINKNVFIGALTIKGVPPYTYRVEFTDSANVITGFSITDLQGPDQTKTAITGSINTSKKEFTFKETRLISTRSKINRDSFCYISAKLKLKERKGAKMLAGSFTGYMKDGRTSCGTGEITLVSKSDIIEKLMKLGPQADTVLKLVEKVDAAVKDEEQTIDAAPKQSYLSVRPGSATSVGCKSNKAAIEIWDNSKIDGDIISLYHNDKTLLSHYTLSNKKEQFIIDLTLSTEKIKLVSEHEGSEPPTTVRLSCTCGDRTFTIDASSSIGKPVELILR